MLARRQFRSAGAIGLFSKEQRDLSGRCTDDGAGSNGTGIGCRYRILRYEAKRFGRLQALFVARAYRSCGEPNKASAHAGKKEGEVRTCVPAPIQDARL